MTVCALQGRLARIIPYQELLGNYDLQLGSHLNRNIIPYQELLGNYDGKKVLDDAE